MRLQRTSVGKHGRLPDGLVAGFDAAADAARLHVSPGGVVLITAEMLAQAGPSDVA